MSASSEFSAILELLGTFFADWRTGTLVLLLVAAAVFDVRSHRIPNKLVLTGVLVGLACSWLLPHPSHQDALFPLEGLLVGFVIFLPLYLLRAMGAGDVKLMAMVGAFVGPGDAFLAALATMIVGGGFALIHVLVNGTAARLYHNLSALLVGGAVSVVTGTRPSLQIDAAASAGRLPYAVPIALGSIGYLVLHHLGFF
jgi:prepilin peptidase CpaA